jgi:hypothetical protein
VADTSDKKRSDRKRNAISADTGREIEHFAKRNGVSLEEARDLIRQFGEERATVAAANSDPKA